MLPSPDPSATINGEVGNVNLDPKVILVFIAIFVFVYTISVIIGRASR